MRLAGGWGAALVSALILSAVLAAPLASPEPAVLAGAVSPSPTTNPLTGPADQGGRPTAGEQRPAFPHWPPAAWQAGAPRPVHLDTLAGHDTRKMQAALDRARADLGLYALTLGVAVDDLGYWAGASGVALDGVTPLDGDSPVAIASITKTFTAALVLQLVDKGRLGLDDRVAPLLPGLDLSPAITVRQLLGHTSGIADLLAPMREPMSAEPERRWSGSEVIERLGGPWFTPGAAYAYSNSNYVILGLLLERVYERPFPQLLERHLLRPLHLDETGVIATRHAPSLMPPSWASAFGTSGNMYSSPSDLLEWAAALYGGRVLRPESMAEMLRFNHEDYGLGAELVRLGGRTGVGHSGLLRGFTSLLVHLPREGVTLAIVGVWQGFDPAGALTYARRGRPSILDVALRAAGVHVERSPSPSPTPAAPGG